MILKILTGMILVHVGIIIGLEWALRDMEKIVEEEKRSIRP